MYVIRVNFPDDDRYTFVTNDEGEITKYYKREDAEKASHTFDDSVVMEIKDEGFNWSL